MSAPTTALATLPITDRGTVALQSASLIACPHCGLVVRYAPVAPKQVARCARCDAVLWRGQSLGVQGLLAFALAATIVFLIAQGTPMVSVSLSGSPRVVGLTSSAAVTWLRGEHVVAALTLATALGAPLLVLMVRLYVLAGLAAGGVPAGFALCMRLLHTVARWNMVEVLTVGALVSIVRMAGLARVEVQAGLFAFGALALLLAAQEAAGHLPLWQVAESRRRTPITASSDVEPATQQGDRQRLLGCPCCHLASTASAARAAAQARSVQSRFRPAAALRCRRCAMPLHADEPFALQRCWALLIASAACYLPANFLPIMQTTSALRTEAHTILGGIAELWEGGTPSLAIIVFVASIMVPLLKIGVLSMLAWSARSAPTWRRLQRARLYRMVDAIGHWSMLDVYVVVLLTAMVRFGAVAGVRQGPGLLPFAAVVVLTVLAAHAFDPKLIWQDHAAVPGRSAVLP